MVETPDLKPIKVDVRNAEIQNDETLGILVSPYIGPKVFANHLAQYFSLAPTKVSLFLIISDENEEDPIREIKLKGNNSNRLIDYGITEGSLIFVKQTDYNEDPAKVYADIARDVGISMSRVKISG